MEKRVLIAIVLSIAVMYGYSMLFPPAKPPVVEKSQTVVTKDAQTSSSSPTPAVATAVPAIVPAQLNSAARDVKVETDVFRAVFTTQGGALKEMILKKYLDKSGTDGKEIVLFKESRPEQFPIITETQAFPAAAATVFSVDKEQLLVSGSESQSLEFTAISGGVALKKKYTFTSAGYVISLDTTLINTAATAQEGTLQTVIRTASKKPADEPGRYEVFGPVTLSDAGVTFDALTDLAKGEKSYQKGVKWTGFGDKYFLKAVLVKNSTVGAVTLKDANGFCDQRIFSEKYSLGQSQQTTFSSMLYLGPKDIDILKAQGQRLEEAIDLGWFSALAKPLLHTIKLFYKYLHNYGLAIILITVILKVLFFPLTHKSYKSMKEMQKLQPRMQELKETHKDDRDALNRSVMELYKTHKVNPLGGCLPMVVQIPVFFGLYKALMFSIELRHAPFYFWLHDLSAKDPYYVTPIIMGATMFIQQKMTPTNMDPIQAKMMLALPLVFTVMFLNFPSGLVLYWLVNNILTIAQQAYINKSLKEA